MADIILTLKQVEDFFQRITTQMLGLNPDAPQNQDKVRIAWPTDGQPAFKITDDIVFLKINNPDEQITKQRRQVQTIIVTI